jgi:FMN-dependent NADH-azoreductase
MPHLLHVDSSIKGDESVSRKLTARAVAAWRAAHPDGTVAYRDLGKHPVPHLDDNGGTARQTPVEQHTPAQAESWRLSELLISEVRAADAVVLGLPLYNYGAPSSVKAWVDHLLAPGLSYDPSTGTGLLEGRDLIVIGSRGGGYGAGTPRHGWDHVTPWLPHALAATGLEPRFITAELTLASVVPAMSDLIPLAEVSMAAAEQEIDSLWATLSV